MEAAALVVAALPPADRARSVQAMLDIVVEPMQRILQVRQCLEGSAGGWWHVAVASVAVAAVLCHGALPQGPSPGLVPLGRLQGPLAASSGAACPWKPPPVQRRRPPSLLTAITCVPGALPAPAHSLLPRPPAPPSGPPAGVGGAVRHPPQHGAASAGPRCCCVPHHLGPRGHRRGAAPPLALDRPRARSAAATLCRRARHALLLPAGFRLLPLPCLRPAAASAARPERPCLCSHQRPPARPPLQTASLATLRPSSASAGRPGTRSARPARRARPRCRYCAPRCRRASRRGTSPRSST